MAGPESADAPSDESAAVVAPVATTASDPASPRRSLVPLLLGFVAEAFGYDGMYLVVAGFAFVALVLMRSPFMATTQGLHTRPVGAVASVASSR